MADKSTILAVVRPDAEGLVQHLRAAGMTGIKVATAAEVPSRLDGVRAVLVDSTAGLGSKSEAAISSFVRSGGGLVMLGPAAGEAGNGSGLAALAGWRPGRLGPETELVLQAVDGHPITDRMAGELRVRDVLDTDGTPPADAEHLIATDWHYRRQVVGYARPVGDGRLVILGLGRNPASYTHPAVRQLVFRALRHASGTGLSTGPVKIGMIGYGAIGRLHAESIKQVRGLELAAVCDTAADRRKQAEQELGVAAHPSLTQLLRDPAVDLVVVGTPPNDHARGVLAALEAGKDVVCEKPFALRAADAARMIAAAQAGGRVLTVYQSRRWDPDFRALQTVVGAGAIGKPFYMESFIGGYAHPCSYWHSHEPISGGTIFDWGSHYLDWVLQLFSSEVVGVSATAHKLVWHDVTNSDQVRVDLDFGDGSQASFLQSDIAAALKPKWYLLGTEGAVVADWRIESVKSRHWTGDLIEEMLEPAESPARVRVLRPGGEGRSHEEVLALPARVPNGFYSNLADHMLAGELLAVPPEQALRTVAVMEAATRSIAAGGRRRQVSI
jgi:predicted dehydrogenase